ncbi:MAG: sulfatase, partial [Polyangiales bacterium]
MMRRWQIVAAAVALALGGSGDDDSEGGKGGAEGSAEAEAAKAAGLDDHRQQLDLMRLAHLADVDHQGLFVDFGTPARMKYTVGHWRTNWGSDGASGDTTYTHAGKRGRLYFHVDDPGPLTVRMRLKPIGTEQVSPYVNGDDIELVTLDKGDDYADYDIVVPADKVQTGENTLMLVFGGTEPVGGEDVSVAMESIRVIPGHDVPEGDYDAPSWGTLKAKVQVGGEARDALAVRRPTTLGYYVQVPEAAKLAFGVGLEGEGEAPVKVRVRPEGGEEQELWSGKAGAEWAEKVVDLGRFAGTVARIELVAPGDGKGRVAWSQPALHVPKPDEASKPDQPKNVVVLLIDTLRASKLQPYNPDSPVETPHLTEVAEQGTIFELPQSPENWTKPSCASILTSLYPVSHGAKKDNSRLPGSADLLSEHLEAKGFQTGSFIANGYVSRKFGFDQGWKHYTNYIRESKNTEAENVFKEAGDWIEKNKDDRFFAYIQTIDPHVPYDPPDKYLKMYDDREYDGQVQPRKTAQLLEQAKSGEIEFSDSDKKRLEALHDGEITYHDHHMGEFIARLKKLGVWEDTLFVITSDHGEEFEEHGSWGHGHSSFQELLHVPLIFHGPGAADGKRVPQVVSTLDIGPTVLELLGIDPMEAAEGRSLVAYMTGETPP